MLPQQPSAPRAGVGVDLHAADAERDQAATAEAPGSNKYRSLLHYFKKIKAKVVFYYFYPKKHSPRHASHAARPDSSLTLVLTVAWVTKKMLIEAVAHVRINNFFTWQPGQITCVGSLPKTGVTCCKKSKRNFSPFFTFWQIPHLNDDLLLWLLLLLRRPSLMIGLGPRLLLLRGRGVRRWSNNELRSSWARKFHIYFLRISIEYFKC